MDAELDNTDLPGQRGPLQHEMRERVVRAAEARFRHYGFGKTTVAEIAADLNVSSAYIYKFFDSKVAICEAVCGSLLTRLDEALWAEARSARPAAERLRRLYKLLLDQSLTMFFNERKLHDMVITGLQHKWASIERHIETLDEIARHIVQEGRTSGEFERKTPLDETANAVSSTFAPFCHPVLLENGLDQDMPAQADAVASLVLRGLAV
jgi:AcrR family transcriptional regulator